MLYILGSKAIFRSERLRSQARAITQACHHLQNDAVTKAQQTLSDFQNHYGTIEAKQYDTHAIVNLYKTSLSNALSHLLNNMLDNSQKAQQITQQLKGYSTKQLKAMPEQRRQTVVPKLNDYFNTLEDLQEKTQQQEQLFNQLLERYNTLQLQTVQMQQQGALEFTDFSAKKQTFVDNKAYHQILKHLNQQHSNMSEDLKQFTKKLKSLHKSVQSLSSSKNKPQNHMTQAQLSSVWEGVGIVDTVEQLPKEKLIRLTNQADQVIPQTGEKKLIDNNVFDQVYEDSVVRDTPIYAYYNAIRQSLPSQILDSQQREPNTLSNREQIINRPTATKQKQTESTEAMSNPLQQIAKADHTDLPKSRAQGNANKSQHTSASTTDQQIRAPQPHVSAAASANNRANPLYQPSTTPSLSRWQRFKNWLKRKVGLLTSCCSTSQIVASTTNPTQNRHDSVTDNPAHQAHLASQTQTSESELQSQPNHNPSEQLNNRYDNTTPDPEQTSNTQYSNQLDSIAEATEEDEPDNSPQPFKR